MTEHKHLTAILGPKKGVPSLTAARPQHWAIILAAYNYNIEFKPTQKHGNADGFSRLPLPNNRSPEYSKAPSVFNVYQIEALPVDANDVKRATRSDPLLKKVLFYTKKGWPKQMPEALKPFARRQTELSIEDDCLMLGVRVIVPKSLQAAVLKQLHCNHPGIARMKGLARGHVWWPSLDKDIETLAKSCQSCLAVKASATNCPNAPVDMAFQTLAESTHRFCGTISQQDVFCCN